MSSSPKRKLSTEQRSSTKKARNGDIEVNGINGANGEHENDSDLAEEIPMIISSALPDSKINHAAAIAYWSSTPATVDGVLGGFPQVSRVDLQGSANFLAKLRRQSKVFPPSTGKLKRVADCGAGIGRVTTGFLRNVAETVDIIEPVKAFTDQIKNDPCVGKIYNVGLEQWQPETKYDVVWNQWCVGQLTDAQLVAYLKSLPQYLNPGGWIVVKENLSNHHLGEDVFDDVDSSVTRTDVKFRQLFNEAGLHLVSTELQKGFPKALYPVRAYALQPRS
ncbi:Alpha N-terminal protein methyltransferase 1 [Pseudocercospora fuligena]|uniref:Alpha N-terminal protein methyltransferase 1 n=1 Tax=Pseudocercospora fuligena TaxID=685502 RepID=A0A8H6R5W4_9PEZI|nr:Alpha N-terminal protein methyltransferase 1 [Pseudocercospora fuligena]